MFKANEAFASFSVNDIQSAREFYTKSSDWMFQNRLRD